MILVHKNFAHANAHAAGVGTIHSFMHACIHLLTHSIFTDSLTHSLIPFVHSFGCSSIR